MLALMLALMQGPGATKDETWVAVQIKLRRDKVAKRTGPPLRAAATAAADPPPACLLAGAGHGSARPVRSAPAARTGRRLR